MSKSGTRGDRLSWGGRGEGGPPLVIAHRGSSAVEPENSLAAFGRAIADGADGVELDVLLCATGEVMVFHDDDLRRLGGLPDRIGDLSLKAIRGVRLTSGATIPTLAEVLEHCGKDLLVNVELKASGITPAGVGALVDRVAGVVERAGRNVGDRVLVSSFDRRAVAFWAKRVPQIRAGLLLERKGMGPKPQRRARALPRMQLFSVHPESVLCTPAAVQDWQRRGHRVNVWTVDDPSELRRFAAMGVDGIITNNPAHSRRALGDS
jgi:glycerophosphoryl diester phosphodiesterase